MADITQFDYTGGEKVQSNVNASDHPNAYALSLELATLLDNQKSAHTDWNAIRTKLREIITELNAKVRTDALITAIDTALGSSDWQTDTNTQLTQEQVQDFAATILNHAGHTNVSVSYDESNNRIILSSSDTDTQLTEEQVQDFAAPLLNHANHTNVSVSYDDANNQIILTVASSGSGGQLTQEEVQDFAAPLLDHLGHSGISATYDDANNQIILSISVTKADVGLGNVDNTSDADKPVSTAQQTAINEARSGAVSDLRNGVPAAGDDLSKLYTLIQNINTLLASHEVTLDTLGISNIAGLQAALDARVPTTRTIAGKALNSDISLVKGDVGLGNVDNTSDATKNAAVATLTNKTISGTSNTLTNIPQGAITDLSTDLASKQDADPFVTLTLAASMSIDVATINKDRPHELIWASGQTTDPTLTFTNTSTNKGKVGGIHLQNNSGDSRTITFAGGTARLYKGDVDNLSTDSLLIADGADVEVNIKTVNGDKLLIIITEF